jgi:hypothetical protein
MRVPAIVVGRIAATRVTTRSVARGIGRHAAGRASTSAAASSLGVGPGSSTRSPLVIIVGRWRRRRVGRSSVRSRTAVIAASRCARASVRKGLGGCRSRRGSRRRILFGQASIRYRRTARPGATSSTTRSREGARTARRGGSRPQARTRMRPGIEIGTVGAKGDHSVPCCCWYPLEAMPSRRLVPILVSRRVCVSCSVSRTSNAATEVQFDSNPAIRSHRYR